MLLKESPFQECIVMAISYHQIIFYISVSNSFYSFHSYFEKPFDFILIVSTVAEKLVELYACHILFFVNGLKKLLCFLHFKLMITLLVACVIIIILILFFFFWILENSTFSNLKLILFIKTGFVTSNKEVKKVVLINHSWISPSLQR